MLNYFKEKKYKGFLLIISFISIDQLSKYLTLFLSNILSLPVFFIFKISANTKLSRVNLTILLMLTVLSVLFWLCFLKNKRLFLPVIFIISGEISNIIDFLFKGFIIDFINLRFFVINIADIYMLYGFYKVIVELTTIKPHFSKQ